MRFEAENETNIELSVVVVYHKEEDIVHGTKEKCRKVILLHYPLAPIMCCPGLPVQPEHPVDDD